MMEKGRGKKLMVVAVATALTLSGAGAVFAEEPLSADEILGRMGEAVKNEKCASVDAAMRLDAGIEIGSGEDAVSQTLSAEGFVSAAADQTDLLKAKTKADFRVEMPGQQDMNVSSEAYIEEEEDSASVWSRTITADEDSGWQEQTDGMKEMIEILKSAEGSMDFAQLIADSGIAFDVEDDEANGRYVLTAEIGGAELTELAENAIGLAGDASKAISFNSEEYAPILNLAKASAEIRIDKETFLPADAYVDFSQTQADALDVLSALLGGSEETPIDFEVSEAWIRMTYGYGDVDVEIPEEVRSEAVSDVQTEDDKTEAGIN